MKNKVVFHPDPRSLKIKALECAVRDIKSAPDREEANSRYLKWKVFHNEPKFKQAVNLKKQSLKN
ncbi:hypothetical protein [Sunxiuqinia indica]|uniref:hypothetical protein n=1 Tax=Sunxiuqinia indica TaxID=2692584 RepID=UPI00135958F3|nr:hypothetical protein [Sunxiuqinia indica]